MDNSMLVEFRIWGSGDGDVFGGVLMEWTEAGNNHEPDVIVRYNEPEYVPMKHYNWPGWVLLAAALLAFLYVIGV